MHTGHIIIIILSAQPCDCTNKPLSPPMHTIAKQALEVESGWGLDWKKKAHSFLSRQHSTCSRRDTGIIREHTHTHQVWLAQVPANHIRKNSMVINPPPPPPPFSFHCDTLIHPTPRNHSFTSTQDDDTWNHQNLNTYLSCHNFFPLSSTQILLVPACCLLCVL